MNKVSRSTKLQAPKLLKPAAQKNEVPFEKYQHFVVCPPGNFASKYGKTSRSSSHEPSKDKSSLSKSCTDLSGNISKTNSHISAEQHINKEISQNITNNVNKYALNSSIKKFEINVSSEELDQFILNASNSNTCEETEKFLLEKFNAVTCIFWENISELNVLYSHTFKVITGRGESLASCSFFTKSIITTDAPTSHPAFSAKIDKKFCPHDSPVMVFPLWDHKNSLRAVIQVVRAHDASSFSQQDEEFANSFATKFKTFSKFLFAKSLHEPFLLEIMKLKNIKEILSEIHNRLTNFFGSRVSEVWFHDKETDKMTRLDNDLDVNIIDGGIVGSVINGTNISNTIENKLHPSYNETIDGQCSEPVLVASVEEGKGRFVYAICLRGNNRKIVFTPEDEELLQKICVFVALSVTNSRAYTSLASRHHEMEEKSDSLVALLEVAEALSGQLDEDKLTEIIMEKGRQLTRSDRCSLFLINETKEKIITSFQHGLHDKIELPIDKGIVGKTIMDKTSLMIDDAYAYPSFDTNTDLDTGYRTKTVLSVPIFNNRGDVIGATEMVNKEGDKTFTQWDAHIIQIFNVFCGISLENARLYKGSMNMSNQLRSFFDISSSLAKNDTIHKILGDIIHNARVVIDCEWASVFLVNNEDKCFDSLLHDGGRLPQRMPLGRGFAGSCYASKEFIICNNCYDDERFYRPIDIENNWKTSSILVGPLVCSTGECIGVVEMVNKCSGEFTVNDLDLLKSFSTFASIYIENQRLRNASKTTAIDQEVDKFVSNDEKDKFEIPTKLKLEENRQTDALSISFNIFTWKEDHYKLLFLLWNRFSILETFGISNDTFSRFIFSIQSTYNNVPYHNWTHACDVVQFTSYQLITAGLDKVLPPLEIFAILLASISHDAGHEGYNNIYNLKVGTPLGVLFKDQSVMETYHCVVLIRLLAIKESNILQNLSANDVKKIWNLIIALILATDIDHQSKLVDEANTLLSEGKFDFENDSDHHLLALKLLINASNISNVSRPFEVAEEWYNKLLEECYNQGDDERSHGIEPTSPLNSRETNDKHKGQTDFYGLISIPLFQTVTAIFPQLNVSLERVKENLNKWNERVTKEDED